MEYKLEETYKQNYDKNSVLVIGAGPCGILSVRHLKDNSNVICIEAKDDIGGMWLFDKINESNHPNLEKNAYYHDNGVLHSSLYENLITNLPKFLMTFKGFPAKEEYDEFMTADQFYEYLQDYSKHNNIKKNILFNTYVQEVRLSKNLTEEERKSVGFEITKRFIFRICSSEDYTSNHRYLQADSVIVANGHFSKPNYAVIENEELFEGHKIHMHYLRQETLKQYINKHLVIYGCSISAQDIIDILIHSRKPNEQPKKITVIGNQFFISILQKSQTYKEELASGKLRFVPTYIKQFDSKNSLTLLSGEKIEDIDCFLHTTGYQYSMPFLEKYFKVDNLIEYYNSNTRKNSFGPLYKNMFSIREPHLIFLGTLSSTLSIQAGLERQALLASLFINGKIELPSQQEMQEDLDKNMAVAKKLNPDCRDLFKVSLFIGQNELEYFRSLAELSKMKYDEQLEEYVMKVLFPVFKEAMMSGDFNSIKKKVFSNQIPLNYSPPLDLF